VALVRDELPDVRLTLVGDGSTRSDVEAYVRRCGLPRNVEFLGETSKVWPFLAKARVFTLATLYEPLGIAVLEAMAAGLPVVATGVGGICEIVEHGRTGFLVPPREPAQMAAYLVHLLADDELADRMGHEACQAAQAYRADRTAEGYARVYEQL